MKYRMTRWEHYSTQKEERNCFKDVNQSKLRFEQAIREQIVKVSATQVLRCIWQFNLQMLLSSQTIEIIMFSAQLKESACPLTLKAPQHAALQQCDVTFRWSTSKHILSTRLKLWWILQQASRAKKGSMFWKSSNKMILICQTSYIMTFRMEKYSHRLSAS